MNWQDIQSQRARFVANCQALHTRDEALSQRLRQFAPAAPIAFAIDGQSLHVARIDGTTAHVRPARLGLAAARQVLGKLCPTGHYTEAVLLAGLDQGWLWDLVYNAPVHSSISPGFRPPVFLASPSLEEFWIACHLHDWQKLLADPRAVLAIGPDAYEQIPKSFELHPALPIPRLCITIDPTIWPEGKNIDSLTREIGDQLSQRLRIANQNLTGIYPPASEAAALARLRGASSLRILGITSQYTTFLQHSMRDWLAAFDAAGHQTRLVIEPSDHEQLNSLTLVEAAADFRPDLILLIDHYRAELGGLPAHCPAVMWIQDYLPHLFNAKAGAAQSPWDYVVGYNRTECTTRFAYPFQRFMPSMVVVNEDRFAPPQLTSEEQRRFECDVCFVSHASTPADQIIQEQIRINPHAKPLLTDAFERLRAIYDAGHFLSHPLHVKGILQEACVTTRMNPDATSLQALIDLFTHRINNALFRHQMLDWAAGLDINLHLCGQGWDKHPRFARFARGPADNTTDLVKIYRAAKINLQATPHGAVHQRLLEGLAAGGFFLIRYVPGDVIERIYQPMWEWCVREGIESDEQLMQRATPEMFKLLGQIQRTLGLDPFKLHMSLLDDIRTGADTGFVRSAATLFADYDHVAFDSAAMLKQKIQHFLTNPEERAAVTQAMRQSVISRMTYRAVNQRLLDFITRDLSARTLPAEAAA